MAVGLHVPTFLMVQKEHEIQQAQLKLAIGYGVLLVQPPIGPNEILKMTVRLLNSACLSKNQINKNQISLS